MNVAAPTETTTGNSHYSVVATRTVADERTRVLKHNDTFAVFNHFGDIETGGLGEEGLYHDGTRFLSQMTLELEGGQPFVLGSTVRDENDQLAVDLTNPDLIRNGHVEIPLGTLHISRRTFLWQAACYQQFSVRNHGPAPLAITMSLRFQADFTDIFEVRGMSRPARGQVLAPVVASDRITLSYRGLDQEVRRTTIQFETAPSIISASEARFDLELTRGASILLHVNVTCGREQTKKPVEATYAQAASGLSSARHDLWSWRIRTGNETFDAWIRRAESDLHMMTSDLPTGLYPYAGVPWFNTQFGRDGIITSLECLWLMPNLARGVLTYLADTQATEIIEEQDAEPGKILHETRRGEMAECKEIPFGHYYGSVDGTPLFVLLAGAYFERTGDHDFADQLWPHVESALNWIDQHGDRDGDGFVEYDRRSIDGLIHQGWKDSNDAIFHADGSPALGAIALCEVQGYVYAAKRSAAAMAAVLDKPKRESELTKQAEKLRKRFDEIFWCDDLSVYALALDGKKQLCRVRTSNAGQCLFSGIAEPDRANRLAHQLVGADFFSGWGVRTVSASELRYNPMSYHNGSVWPHDNAIIGLGLARYGMQELAVRILTGMFEAGTHFDLMRMPELFCGFERQPREAPIRYPVACSPQAWAAGSVFLLLQACLGLGISGADNQIELRRPQLPEFLKELRITSLAVGDNQVDLLLTRHEDDVGVHVLHRIGNAQVIVVK
jgi:glycogen debranching enzyme